MSFCKGMGSVVLAVSKTLYFSNPIPNDRRECGVGYGEARLGRCVEDTLQFGEVGCERKIRNLLRISGVRNVINIFSKILTKINEKSLAVSFFRFTFAL